MEISRFKNYIQRTCGIRLGGALAPNILGSTQSVGGGRKKNLRVACAHEIGIQYIGQD